MNNEDYARSIGIKRETEDWQNALAAMAVYGDIHWWEEDSPLHPEERVAYMESERIMLILEPRAGDLRRDAYKARYAFHAGDVVDVLRGPYAGTRGSLRIDDQGEYWVNGHSVSEFGIRLYGEEEEEQNPVLRDMRLLTNNVLWGPPPFLRELKEYGGIRYTQRHLFEMESGLRVLLDSDDKRVRYDDASQQVIGPDWSLPYGRRILVAYTTREGRADTIPLYAQDLKEFPQPLLFLIAAPEERQRQQKGSAS